MAIKVNRINRNFGIKVHLYFNSNSFNRPSDSTPRFFLKPIELLSIEKVGFTKKAKDHGYERYGHKLWKGKGEESLTQAEILAMYEEIKNSYPYGYVENDTASTNKYIFDVKENEAFQSFYKTYWNKNLDKVKQPILATAGYDYDHPYIEFNVNEIITYKHNIGTVPALPESLTQWGSYSDLYAEYYTEPVSWSCNDESLEVNYNINHFLVEKIGRNILKFGTTGNRYRLDLKTDDTYAWPTGTVGADGVYGSLGGDGTTGYSGFQFRLSTGSDGPHNSFDEYETESSVVHGNVSYITSPETAYYHVSSQEKTWGNAPNHPWYSSGSISGFILSGSGGTAAALDFTDEGPTLTLRRESKYYFYQIDGYNSGHPIYISTDKSGAGADVYSSGVRRSHVASHYDDALGVAAGEAYTVFTVPVNAPDTLYYACEHHEYMGGQINIVDAPVAPYTGTIPGESLVVTFTGDNNRQMFYYCTESGEFGGNILLMNDCGSEMTLFDNENLAGSYGYA